MVSNCRKENSFRWVENSFLPEQSFPTGVKQRCPILEKKDYKRKRFPRDRKSVSITRNEKFVWKYISARQKYLSLAGVSEKWKRKNQFPRAKIRFLLRRLLPPNFKISSRALIKIMPMKKLLKKRFHLREKLPLLPGISNKWEKQFFTRQTKQFLLGAITSFL